jgi:hypothetical protein
MGNYTNSKRRQKYIDSNKIKTRLTPSPRVLMRGFVSMERMGKSRRNDVAKVVGFLH